MTEDALSGVVKAVASKVGGKIGDSLSESLGSGVGPGGATGGGGGDGGGFTIGIGGSGFLGRMQEEMAAKKSQALARQAELMDQQANMGTQPTLEQQKAWTQSGGDPGTLASLTQKAMGFQTRRKATLDAIDQMSQQAGPDGKPLLDPQVAQLMHLATISGDPAFEGLAKTMIADKMAMAKMFTQAGLKHQEDVYLHDPKSGAIPTAQRDLEQTREANREYMQGPGGPVAQREEGLAAYREKLHVAGESILKGIGGGAMDKGRIAALGNVDSVVAAASGDPTALKKLMPAGSEGMSPDQIQAAFAGANAKLADQPNSDLTTMLNHGAMSLTSGSEGGYFSADSRRTAAGVGLPALVEDAANKGVHGITPDTAAQFRQQWMNAMADPNPTSQGAALDAAIAMLPPEAQAQINQQIDQSAHLLQMKQQVGPDTSLFEGLFGGGAAKPAAKPAAKGGKKSAPKASAATPAKRPEVAAPKGAATGGAPIEGAKPPLPSYGEALKGLLPSGPNLPPGVISQSPNQ